MAYETVNPASGARLKSFDDISEAALESAVATAQRAYQTELARSPGRGARSDPFESGGAAAGASG